MRYKYYKKNMVVLVWLGAKPERTKPNRLSRSKSAHKCIPYNNRREQNFI